MSTNKKVLTGIVVIAALGVVGMFFVPQLLQNQAVNPAAAVVAADGSGTQPIDITAGGTSLPGGLVFKDEVVGTGTVAVAGQQVTVNYVGALQNGTVFDASAQHGGSFSFVLGAGTVIPGWDQGLVGMKVGGKRLLTIPSTLAYGSQAIQGKDAQGNNVDVIPANSTLLFEVELVGVGKTGAK